MPKICAIGNSHISALVLAWKTLAGEFPDLEIKFVGVQSKLLRDVTVSQGELVSANLALRRAFQATRAGHYRALIICGLDFGSGCVRKLFSGYRAESHAKDDRVPISDSCFTEALRRCLFDSAAIRTIRELRHVTSVPFMLIPEPLPGEVSDDARKFNFELNHDDRILVEQLEQAFFGVAAACNSRVVLQPDFTRAGYLRTLSEYSRGSLQMGAGMLKRGIAIPHPENEVDHMNEKYGGIMLRLVLQRLAEIQTFQNASDRVDAAEWPSQV